ncbi:S1C family serine protease [Allofournierella sp.]|uniref:S1C family serine protease n=1 Tax=Allofournierella sp. TaxID=1940256 RepID=UPI003AB1C145
MENKWEYDYSGLYHNGYTPAPGPYQPLPPEMGEQGPLGPEPPRKKKGRGKKIVSGALALVLVAGVSFGGGYAGFKAASAGQTDRIVYQAPTSTPASGTGTTAANLVGVINAVNPSVVAVTTEQMVTSNFWGGQQVVSGAGSGVIFTADGYIITNNHVIEGAQQIKVKLSDDTEYTAKLIGTDSQSDIAVLKIDATGLTPAVLGDSDSVQVGELSIAVGNPLGTLSNTATDGIISGLDREVTVQGNTMRLMQTSAAVSPGNSGGGLFNANGELVGIVNAKSTGEYAEGLGFAIPINTAKQVAQDLIENGYVTGRPALGITVISISDAQTAMQYGVSSFGVYVQSVTSGSGADKAGMKVGDRIVSVGSQLVESTSDVTNALKDLNAGDVVEVQVDRSRELMTLNITLGERTQA